MTDARKQMKIAKLPSVLSLQLKRFDFTFSNHGEKNTKPVNFDEILDIAPFSIHGAKNTLYYLYAVLVHSGYSCHSGHYYCYVKNSNGTWYQMDDEEVTQTSIKQVLLQKKGAYVLLYSRKPEEKVLSLL